MPPGKYILELGELGNAVKQLILESVVREKAGEAGCRLYRMLLRRQAHGGCSARGHQKFELSQLADMTLMPEREARPLLILLLQSEYVMVQEVPRTLDRNPKATTFLWHISLQHAYRAVERAMLHSLVNLHRRLRHECKEHAALLPRNFSEAANLESAREQTRVAHRQESFLAQRRIRVLENSILQLHETVMVLRTA